MQKTYDEWKNGQMIDDDPDGTDAAHKEDEDERAEHPERFEQREPPYPWCYGAPTVQNCIKAGYCRRNPNCGE